ncbi:MAG TPA: ABC transporter permease [Gammaproteobacteria bacterium]|nr:ABC transporter permease [Gammaproteobacteria bacterium]
MNMIQFLGALEIGLLYGLVSLGVYLTFRAINFPDLTVDGTFPLGAAVAATLLVNGVHPILATIAAIFAGGLAGFITGYLHVRWNILGLLAGILTMTALYSVNLRIMGRPNIALLSELTLFSYFKGSHVVLWSMFGIIIGVLYLLYRFLASQFGLALRATGINPRVSPSYGINIGLMTLIGLAASNGLVALAGALFAQAHGFADISLGTGTLITGLASVIVGESLLPKHRLWFVLIACVLGSILYRLAIALALNSQFAGLQAQDLNLITAVLVVIAMLVPKIRQKFTLKPRQNL